MPSTTWTPVSSRPSSTWTSRGVIDTTWTSVASEPATAWTQKDNKRSFWEDAQGLTWDGQSHPIGLNNFTWSGVGWLYQLQWTKVTDGPVSSWNKLV